MLEHRNGSTAKAGGKRLETNSRYIKAKYYYYYFYYRGIHIGKHDFLPRMKAPSEDRPHDLLHESEEPSYLPQCSHKGRTRTIMVCFKYDIHY